MMTVFEALDRLEKLPSFVVGYHGTDEKPMGSKKLLHLQSGLMLQAVKLNSKELALSLRNITLGKTVESYDLFTLHGVEVEKYVTWMEGESKKSVFE